LSYTGGTRGTSGTKQPKDSLDLRRRKSVPKNFSSHLKTGILNFVKKRDPGGPGLAEIVP